MYDTDSIKQPKWNPRWQRYEFESGLYIMAWMGVIGLEPKGTALAGANTDYEIELIAEGGKFTDAEKIGIADMMIERWNVYRNIHIKALAGSIANEKGE